MQALLGREIHVTSSGTHRVASGPRLGEARTGDAHASDSTGIRRAAVRRVGGGSTSGPGLLRTFRVSRNLTMRRSHRESVRAGRSRDTPALRRAPESRLYGVPSRGWIVALGLAAIASLASPAGVAGQARPTGEPPEPSPLPISIGLYVADFPDLDEDEKTFEFEATLSLHWRDGRLAFDPAEEGAGERVWEGDYQFAEVFPGWWPQLVLRNQAGPYERQSVTLRVRPDGSVSYEERIQAVAEATLDLHAVPFDRQVYEIVFALAGFGSERVRLVPDPDRSGRAERMTLIQWEVGELAWEEREFDAPVAAPHEGGVSAVTFRLPLERRPGYILYTVVFPLMLLVALTWSVFWMDRESLGSRMDLSFIGILTVVAFQIVVGDKLPRIPYLTLLNAFLYLSYAFLAASVVVNLRVGALDAKGESGRGDRLDRRCRWAFPAGYFAGTALLCAYYVIRY